MDRLDAERQVRGYFRNLVVAATGTGKTIISALDYKRFCKQNPDKPCRLLFVAHREEILKQSMHTFRAVLKDANFGEMFVGNYKPDSIDHLFISIQTFNSQKFTEKTTKDYYDFIIVDGTPNEIVADDTLLYAKVDSAIIVAKYNSTKYSSIIKLKKNIKNQGGNTLGVIINNIPYGYLGEKKYYYYE